MPLFGFQCEHCGETREVIRTLETMSDELVCLGCGENMRKIITTSNFVLAGSSWAKDGYK